MADDERGTVNLAKGLSIIHSPDLPSVYMIYELITANDLEGIRSRLDRLTLCKRHSIVATKAFNKTLLRYACELRFRDIVKYLLDECGLDISERYTHRLIWLSPLRISIGNLDVSMVVLLISRGAVVVDKIETETDHRNVNIISNFSMKSIFSCCTYGTSELLPVLPLIKNMASDEDADVILRATARGDLDEMKILRAYGINVNEANFFNDNALCIAILNKRSDAENFLLNYGRSTLKDHLRALELCGATFIACQSDIEQGLLCWRKSLRIRKDHFFGVSDKLSNKYKTGLGVEFTCEKELDMMANSETKLHIQAVIVFARLLPLNNKFLQDTFVKVAQKPVFRNKLLQALKVLAVLSEFPYNLNNGDDKPSDKSVWSLETLLRIPFSRDPSNIDELLFRFKKLIGAYNGFNWKVLLTGKYDFYLSLYTQLITSLLQNIVAMQGFDLCKTDKAWIKDDISGIMHCPSGAYSTTLLHMAIEEAETLPVIDFIVSCSTDANCMDINAQTPMHIAAYLEEDRSYILPLVNMLADAGGHIDALDRYNIAPFTMFKENSVIINPLKYLSLQCLAAQTIHKYKIEIPEIYPKILVSFIKLHSNDTNSTSLDEVDVNLLEFIII